ncbi:MAG TPA: cytochrome P460 family protein [Gaiellaceae bacterium]|nr:cytochrome P460 family protein [Gaiellaceae bacterium]
MRVGRLALLAVVLVLAACGGSSEPASAPETTEPVPPPAATTEPVETEAPAETTTAEEEEPEAEPQPRAPPGIPGYVAGYRDWPKLNDEPIPLRSSDPHAGTKDVYASRPRRANGTFPNGTIVVKEAARPGRDFIGLIAVMRKRPGANPEHNDWVFVEWAREARREPFREIARDAVCWSCHVGARDLDYVFTE